MSTYSKFLSLISGTATTVDLSSTSNSLGLASLQLLGSTSGMLTHQASATTTSYSLTWPAAQGTANQVLAQSGTAGILAWTTISSGITQLTGDVTAGPGSGSQVATLAATSNATLTTLSALTTASSLSSVGTITSGAWNGTQIGPIYGGTGQTAYTTGDTLYASASNTLAKLGIGSTGQVLTVVSGIPAWSTPAATGADTALNNLTSPTAINQDLLPGSSLSNQLGSPTNIWNNLSTAEVDFYNPSDSSLAANITVSGSGANSGILATIQKSIDFESNAGGIFTIGNAFTAIHLNSPITGSATWQASPVGIGFGGTGAADAADAFAALSPLSIAGDIIYEDNTPAPAVLSIGTNGQVLTVVSGLPAWASAATGTVTSVSVVTANGLAGTVATSTTTPAITLSTTVTGILQGNGTAISAATTTGTGSVVLSASPTLTGIVSAAALSLSSALNMNSNQINNLATPSLATDAATKGYVDSAIAGLTWQGPAKAYAASNVPLTGGSTLTIDSYPVQNGDLVILGNQTTASQNGEYTASGIGTAYVLTANGLPTAAGDAWLILNGTLYGDSAFVANAAVPAATFTEFAGPTAYTFNAPLSLSGRTVSITQSNTSTNGYLSSTDWNTFNNKQPAGNYITALTGDATATGPGSSALTLATVNSNVGSFAIATVTVNAKGLVTAASAATTTGTGSVVLAASPTLTGTVLATNATLSGNLVAPTIQLTATYNGVATLTANTTYALRWGVAGTPNSEVAGDLYLADWTTDSDEYWVVGLFNSTSSTTTGTSITITTGGLFTLGSSDTNFGTGDQGKPVWLGASGAYAPNSTFSPSSGDANVKLGIAQSATKIWIQSQFMGIS